MSPGADAQHRSCLLGLCRAKPSMPLLAAVAAISDALAAPGGTSSSTLLAAPDDLADRKVAQTCKCTISAEKLGRPPTLDHAIGGTRKPTRYLFIMGYPFTGTTAFHALLAQGMNVSALDGLRGQRQALLSPEKEGWAKLGWKHREDVWSASDSALNWTALSETYHRNWNLKKPLLVENSPPEMSRADALNRTRTSLATERLDEERGTSGQGGRGRRGDGATHRVLLCRQHRRARPLHALAVGGGSRVGRLLADSGAAPRNCAAQPAVAWRGVCHLRGTAHQERGAAVEPGRWRLEAKHSGGGGAFWRV